MKKQQKRGVQRAERQTKSRKRAGKEISGFSTLSQVAGLPRQRQHHSSIPVPDMPRIHEPHPVCQFCGEGIENIASALSAPSGGYVHFDCALNHIREAEHPGEGMTLSYAGSGRFAIFSKDENGSYHIEKTIIFEPAERTRDIKAYIEELRAKRKES